MTHAFVRAGALLASALLTVTLFSATVPSPTAAADEDPGTARAEAAEEALERVEAMLDGRPGRPGRPGRRAGVPARTDVHLTLALRDLAVVIDDLRGADRRTAERILARPTDNESSSPSIEPKYGNADVRTKCSKAACVHFARSGDHEAAPAYADTVLAAVTRSNRIATDRLGFRRPLRDPGTRKSGGNRKPDIYLGDLPPEYFGYAVPEGYYAAGGKRAAFGYVVLDNDYRNQCQAYYDRCGTQARRALMRATAAHEYSHLIQFGYDHREDGWFMEATATWIEDEAFDGVNDNVNFLYASPSALQRPKVPLDAPRANPYANWIYFRHLSEKFGPTVVGKAWGRADAWRGTDGSRRPANLFSIRATRRAMTISGGNWNRDFATFADGNRRTARHYAEGRLYPNAPLASRATLRKDAPRAVRDFALSRLASATHRVRPNTSLRRGWRLRVTVKGNTATRGGHALATVRRKDGGFGRVHLPLGGDGKAVRTLPFGTAKVRWVEITVVNASTRYECDLGRPRFTCHGRSRDDNRPQQLVVKAVR